MSRAKLTAKAVDDACRAIQEAGEVPSVRKIHARLGGSHATISELLQQWKEKNNAVKLVDGDISDYLREALLAEFSHVTKKVKENLQSMILDKDKSLSEMQILLSDHETKIESLDQQLSEAASTHKSKLLQLEKAVSAAQARAEAAEKRELYAKNALTDLQDRCHQAEIKAAAAQAKCDIYERGEMAKPKAKKNHSR